MSKNELVQTGTPEQYKFLKEFVQGINGWLIDYTAIRTMDLLEWQRQFPCHGPLHEISVFETDKNVSENSIGIVHWIGTEYDNTRLTLCIMM